LIRIILTALLIVLGASAAQAVLPEEMLKNPQQEQRARDISSGLRCLVCQNQSIDDSNASLARDLRLIVRERIVAGDDDKQVVDYIVSRYGNYVLLKPPFQMDTVLLWFLPFALLLVALGVAFNYLRGQPEPEAGEAQNEILKSE
jgi:cytochrome c-type biogenesis protein CcmH